MKIPDIKEFVQSCIAMPDLYDTMFRLHESQPAFSEFCLSDVELALKQLEADLHSPSLENLLSPSLHPAFLLDLDGNVQAMNGLAKYHFGLRNFDHISQIDFTLAQETEFNPWFSGIVKGVKAQRDDGAPKSIELEAGGILLLYPVHCADRQYWILSISRFTWTADLARILFHNYDLSQSELEILESFSSGLGLTQIAKVRHRALTTVRKQFYCLLEKINVKSQVDLTKKILLLQSSLQSAERSASDFLRRTEARSTLERASWSGRSVAFHIEGDPKGTPVVMLNSLFFSQFSQRDLHRLKERGFCLIALSRPGFGESARPEPGEGNVATLAHDIAQALETLGADSANVIAGDVAFGEAVRVAVNRPSLIRQILSPALLLPLPFRSPMPQPASTLGLCQQLMQQDAKTRKLFFATLAGALSELGAEYILPGLYGIKGDSRTSHFGQSALAGLQMLEGAIKVRGLDAIRHELEAGFADCSSALMQCKVPITLCGLGQMPYYHAPAAKDFARLQLVKGKFLQGDEKARDLSTVLATALLETVRHEEQPARGRVEVT